MSQTFKEQVKAAVAIEELIGHAVKLTSSGGQYKGLCPFHKEKTPSFYVYPQSGTYHCFGCQAHGDIFSYVMQTKGLEFRQAMEELCLQNGIEMPKRSDISVDTNQHLFDVLDKAKVFFSEQLKSKAAVDCRTFLDKRAIDKTIRKDFHFGFAPKLSVSELIEELQSDRDTLLAVGLLREFTTDNGSKRLYSFFSHRAMLPIQDVRKRTVGFVGRALDDQAKAKYLNSPETELFKKSQVIFGLSHYRPSVDKGIILVEGQLDVVALHQHGFTTAVAPMGTAITRSHFVQLFKRATTVIVAFDGDRAGLAATGRAIREAARELQAGREIRIVDMPAGHDPDSLLREQGKEALDNIIANAETLSQYYSRNLALHSKSPEQLAKNLYKVYETISTIPDAVLRSTLRRHIEADYGEVPEIDFTTARPSHIQSHNQLPHNQTADEGQPLSPAFYTKLHQLAICVAHYGDTVKTVDLPPSLDIWLEQQNLVSGMTALIRQVLIGLQRGNVDDVIDSLEDSLDDSTGNARGSKSAWLPPADKAVSVVRECLYYLGYELSTSDEFDYMVDNWRAKTLPATCYSKFKKLLLARKLASSESASEIDAMLDELRNL